MYNALRNPPCPTWIPDFPFKRPQLPSLWIQFCVRYQDLASGEPILDSIEALAGGSVSLPLLKYFLINSHDAFQDRVIIDMLTDFLLRFSYLFIQRGDVLVE